MDLTLGVAAPWNHKKSKIIRLKKNKIANMKVGIGPNLESDQFTLQA